ncbi:hypothetical protein HID58_074879, partial [Brassica napus]
MVDTVRTTNEETNEETRIRLSEKSAPQITYTIEECFEKSNTKMEKVKNCTWDKQLEKCSSSIHDQLSTMKHNEIVQAMFHESCLDDQCALRIQRTAYMKPMHLGLKEQYVQQLEAVQSLSLKLFKNQPQ